MADRDDAWSEGQWEAAHRIGLLIQCEHCLALPGHDCHVKGKPSRPAEQMHEPRTVHGMAAWASGYKVGLIDGRQKGQRDAHAKVDWQ